MHDDDMVERVARTLRQYEIAPGHWLQRAVADTALADLPADRLEETVEAVFFGMAAAVLREVAGELERLRAALEAIADGEGDACIIARQTLDGVEDAALPTATRTS